MAFNCAKMTWWIVQLFQTFGDRPLSKNQSRINGVNIFVGNLSKLQYNHSIESFAEMGRSSNHVLLGVDLQNDFIKDYDKDHGKTGALGATSGLEVISNTNRILLEMNENFAGIIYTKDHHPSGHSSFIEQGGPWMEHCVVGTDGSKFHSTLDIPTHTEETWVATDNTDADFMYTSFDQDTKQWSATSAKITNNDDNTLVVSKARMKDNDAYGMFLTLKQHEQRAKFSKAADKATITGDGQIKPWLDHKIKSDGWLIVTGLATDYCVCDTVMQALELEVVTRVLVIIDATGPIGINKNTAGVSDTPEVWLKGKLQAMFEKGAKFSTVDKLIESQGNIGQTTFVSVEDALAKIKDYLPTWAQMMEALNK